MLAGPDEPGVLGVEPDFDSDFPSDFVADWEFDLVGGLGEFFSAGRLSVL